MPKAEDVVKVLELVGAKLQAIQQGAHETANQTATPPKPAPATVGKG